MDGKIKKIKRGYYLKTTMINTIKNLSEKHGLSQNQIVERALKREISRLKMSKPII